MSQRSKPPFRADHVGSLLRPIPVIEAREKWEAGDFPEDELHALEDAAIRDAIAMQQRVGIQAVTDGEMRRTNWRDRFFERVDGFADERVGSNFTFTDYSGEKFPGVPVPIVTEALHRREPLTADDFAFLKAEVTQGAAKATLPSPTVNHFFAGDASFTKSPYGDRKTYFDAVTEIYRQEVADLAALGCTYLQVDEVPLAVMCDPNNKQIVRERGEDPDALVGEYVGAINDAIRGRPDDMAVCVHLCRGNIGYGQGAGGYDPIAEQLFQGLEVDGFFLEYDDERSGSFEPLKFVPKGKAVVLGMISTKLRELEDADEMRRRVDAAAEYVDMDDLCLSPQCGFASIYKTDRFTMDDEERKLAYIVELADRIWS